MFKDTLPLVVVMGTFGWMMSIAVEENTTLNDVLIETGDDTTVAQPIKLVLYVSYIEVTCCSHRSHHQPAVR